MLLQKPINKTPLTGQRSTSFKDRSLTEKPSFGKRFASGVLVAVAGLKHLRLNLYNESGKGYAGVIASYEKAFDLNPTLGKAYEVVSLQLTLANKKIKNNENDAAEAIFNKMLFNCQNIIKKFNAFPPKQLGTFYIMSGVAETNLAAFKLEQKDIKAAKELYKSAITNSNKTIEMVPNGGAVSYLNRAVANKGLGDLKADRGDAKGASIHYKTANSDCTTAIRINTGFAEAYELRNSIRRGLGDNRGADEDIKTAGILKNQEMQFRLSFPAG